MDQQIKLERSNGSEQVISCAGDWTAENANALETGLSSALSQIASSASVRLKIDGVGRLDTIGAWLITRFQHDAESKGARAVVEGGTEQHQHLLERIASSSAAPPKPKPRANFLMAPFTALGHLVAGSAHDVVSANAVQGKIMAAFGRTATFQAPMRFPTFVNQFEQIVLRAIPIVALISVVVGAIITQQTILQLSRYGATIFVVDLSALLMFREIGVLLAAIMVAGRSGSAITAELGSMRMQEEFDALKVMGVDPYQALLLPRVMALVVGLPLLAFIGAMAGLGGAIMVAKFYGTIPLNVFINRLQSVFVASSLIAGMIKAPFMGFLIGLIASIEGMKVEGSSESLGRHTTSAVVKAIFIVIVADGLFAMFFAAIKF